MNQGQPDAISVAAFAVAPVVRALPQRLLARHVQRAMGAVKRHDVLAQRAWGVRGGEVYGPEGVRRHAGEGGQPVHVLFQRELHLHGAKAAECAGDAVVGVGQPRLHAHGAVLVGAGGVLDRRVQDFGAVRGVGARVGKDVDLLERQAPPRVDAGAHADAHGVALDAQVHRLRPREVQAHGPLRLPGQQRCDGLNRQLVLAAVRPADGRAQRLKLVGGQAQHVCNNLPFARGVVTTKEQTQPAAAVGFGHAAFCFQVRVHLARRVVGVLQHMGAGGFGGGHIAAPVIDTVQQVAAGVDVGVAR